VKRGQKHENRRFARVNVIFTKCECDPTPAVSGHYCVAKDILRNEYFLPLQTAKGAWSG
jgi:hypothetical protein